MRGGTPTADDERWYPYSWSWRLEKRRHQDALIVYQLVTPAQACQVCPQFREISSAGTVDQIFILGTDRAKHDAIAPMMMVDACRIMRFSLFLIK